MSKIDTSRPVEAVNKETGKVVPMKITDGAYRTAFGGVLIKTERGPCPQTSNDLWYTDGVDRCSHNKWFLRNVAQTLNLNPGDRVVTPEGYTGTIKEPGHASTLRGGRSYTYGVKFDEGTPAHVANGNCFHADGTQTRPADQLDGAPTRIDPIKENTMNTPIKIGDKLECGFLSGSACFVATVIAYTPSGDLIVDATGLRGLYRINRHNLKDDDGDQWELVVPETTEWVNVYVSGETGETIHKSWEDAVARSKFYKTRIGIIERVRRDGGIVRAKVHPTTPQMRSARQPNGINPFA